MDFNEFRRQDKATALLKPMGTVINDGNPKPGYLIRSGGYPSQIAEPFLGLLRNHNRCLRLFLYKALRTL